jgi:tetratricopeptide (TPR) repeat protein
MRTDDPAPRRHNPVPLVSIVVRSMGRPELRLTLESIARQDYPAIEAVIVDATGGRHPALPSLHWSDGHAVRIVSRAEPLKRPQAAALGLESARGDWFTFLDDDDTCEPAHVSTLMAAARAHPRALVVYGCGRLHDAEGRVQQVFGRPFNRALMHYGPLFYWQSALISTRVRDLDCRFDSALEICEDRDFLAQIAEHGDFVFVPTATTFNYRPDLGTSGTGDGANRNVARVARFENMLRAKWAGPGIYHNERAATRCRRGVHAYFSGDFDGSREAFESVLAEYPDDPNAVHGLARVAYARGDLESAERNARHAIEINPAAGEYRTTLAEILAAAGAASPFRDAAPVPRVAPCPCGSGLRYKACCGRLESTSPDRLEVGTAPDVLLERVQRELTRGEAHAARTLLQSAVADPAASRQCLVVAARLELALDSPGTSFALLQRAAALAVDAEVGLMLEECCEMLADRERRASLWAMVSRVSIGSRSRSGRSSTSRPASSMHRPVIRIAGAFPRGSASLRQAVVLRDLLEDVADVALVASSEGPGFAQTEPDSDGAASGAGTMLVLFDAETDWALRVGMSHPERIVVRLPRDDPEALLRCLARLQEAWPHSALQFTLPHAQIPGGDGHGMPVEYPWIDPALFALPLATNTTSLVIGRHGPAAPGDDHPNDGALYRSLIADGHRVEVPETPFLRRAFEDDAPAKRPTLAGEHVAGLALQGFDVVLFRGAHNLAGSADARVLEAMAAARPVVAFAHSVGAREWIVNARTGFVVETDEEARLCIAQFAASRHLRHEIGLAARHVAVAAMEAQRLRARAFYLGVSLNVNS